MTARDRVVAELYRLRGLDDSWCVGRVLEGQDNPAPGHIALARAKLGVTEEERAASLTEFFSGWLDGKKIVPGMSPGDVERAINVPIGKQYGIRVPLGSGLLGICVALTCRNCGEVCGFVEMASTEKSPYCPFCLAARKDAGRLPETESDWEHYLTNELSAERERRKRGAEREDREDARIYAEYSARERGTGYDAYDEQAFMGYARHSAAACGAARRSMLREDAEARRAVGDRM
jgi:hypothetical protein